MGRVYKFHPLATVRLSGTNFDFVKTQFYDFPILPGGDDSYNNRKAREILESQGYDVQDVEMVIVDIWVTP